MEDCTPFIEDDETTSTSSIPTSSVGISSFSSLDEIRHNTSDLSNTESEEEIRPDVFPIMELPAEIRCKILNMQNQRSVPILRLVCRQWKEEVDQYYEFAMNIYDTTTNLNVIRSLRCRECVIWKLTQKLEPPTLFNHPAYLRVIKVYGPASAENLQNLISASTNLEHLTLTRRANYPWYLNIQDTPALNNLTELRYLRLNSEEHILLSSHPDVRKDTSHLKKPPMMDCYFPKLKHFEILKRFAVWQYSHYVTCILQFVARHSKTLTNIELDLIPLSCVAILGDQDESDSSEDDEEFVAGVRGRRSPRKRKWDMETISPEAIQLPELCNLRLKKCCVTTKGNDGDIFIWKSILEQQTELRELRFDWLCRDPRAEIRARITGFPWIHFQAPIEQCTSTLVHVELASLSMFAKDFPITTSTRNISSRVIPFDLGIFRNCHRLKSLILRCRENHAKLQRYDLAKLNPQEDGGAVGGVGENNGAGALAVPAEGQPGGPLAGLGDDDDESAGEVLLMMNGQDLPCCLEQLEIFRFPMLTSDIELMVGRLVNVRKLFLHECGKTGNFGVSANVIRKMASLTSLKFLEVINFNDSTAERKRELEEIFQAIGIPYEGQDTWLEFSDGSSSAHESLNVLL